MPQPSHQPGSARGTAGRWGRQALRHLPVALLALAVLLAGSAPLAGSWFAASRLAYVLYVAGVLQGMSRRGPPAAPPAREAEWQRFRRRVSWLQDNDAAAFAALALVTRGTAGFPWPAWPPLVVGALLCVIGLGVKVWATASLPAGAYYWRNFFFPSERSRVSRTGPYRWLTDPMYSIGYAHVYGWALFLGSMVGLVAAAAAQTLMLLLAAFVERRSAAVPATVSYAAVCSTRGDPGEAPRLATSGHVSPMDAPPSGRGGR